MVRVFILSAAVTLFFHESANAAAPADSPPPPDRLLSLESKTLTGDWIGFRRALDDRGVRVNLFLNHQYEAIARGGLPSKRDDRSSASTS